MKQTAETRKTKATKRAERPDALTTEAPAPVTDEIFAPDLDDEEYSSSEYEEMLGMYDETIGDIREGEVVKGKVMGVGRDEVIVDVGFKSEGVIPISEFSEPLNISVGDDVEVFLDAMEDQNGQLILSKQKADFMRVWDRIREAYEQGATVDGRLMRRIKGGLVVDLFGVEAFLPGSQVALRQVPDFESLIGEVYPMKIIKLNKSRRNIVVSRRAVLEEERESMRADLLQEIAVDQVRTGIVKNITDFGVFIDLGGVDGLLHITDMSWGRIRHPSEMVNVGDEIDVKVLDYDPKSTRISLGLKQLTPYPWEDVEQKYPVGSTVSGRVVSITDYGAFVELEKGVEGLVHISEMSWTQHIKHPSKLMQVGDTIEAMVLNVDAEHQKISLGIKQLEPDPWSTVEQRYPVGTRHEGKVRNLTAFGAFVELEEGIDGLVHISDMSWTRRVQHPSEIMKKGDVIPVIVMHVDAENRKISLGHKQVFDDPWPNYHEQFRVGNEKEGPIVRMLDRGVVVELDGEVEGFVPVNQLGKPDLEKPEDAFKTGETLKMRVIEFDPSNRRIVLSVDAFYRDKDKAELDEFIAQHETTTTQMGEALADAAEAKAEEREEAKAEEKEKAKAEAKEEAKAEEEPKAEALPTESTESAPSTPSTPSTEPPSPSEEAPATPEEEKPDEEDDTKSAS
ncbi:MAG: 30S ribosomal protein S1 [candidate division Zixibacteria bacterium]|nr:30S ribosomal protein S1 [candidate division Zixibacteria bacterium]